MAEFRCAEQPTPGQIAIPWMAVAAFVMQLPHGEASLPVTALGRRIESFPHEGSMAALGANLIEDRDNDEWQSQRQNAAKGKQHRHEQTESREREAPAEPSGAWGFR